MPNAKRSLGSVLALLVVAAGAFGLSAWLLRDGSHARPHYPSLTCPGGTQQLAGHDFRTTPMPVKACDVLAGARFDGMDVGQEVFSGSDLVGASFRGAQADQAEFVSAQLNDAHLENASLIQADLRGADLEGAHLDNADLSQADLTGADLRGAHLGGADLSQATLVGAILVDADLNTTGLTQADLTGADLRGASLWLTSSIQTQMSRIRVDPVQAGVVQLGLLVLAAAVVAGGLSIVRPRAKSWLGMAGVAVMASMFLSILQLVPLWTVKIAGWDALAAGVLLLAAAVTRYRSVAIAVPVPGLAATAG
jgi:hypothetical protein